MGGEKETECRHGNEDKAPGEGSVAFTADAAEQGAVSGFGEDALFISPAKQAACDDDQSHENLRIVHAVCASTERCDACKLTDSAGVSAI